MANYHSLTLNVPCISEICIEIKIQLNFYFHISLRCLKSKSFIKTFEAPQGNVKIKIQLNFFSLSGIGMGKVKVGRFQAFQGHYQPEKFILQYQFHSISNGA